MQQHSYHSRPQQRQYEPGTITGRRGAAEGFTRMAIVCVGAALVSYAVVTFLRSGDDTPYNYPADNAGPPRGRQDCTYDGRKLSCGPRQTQPTAGRPQGMHLDPNETAEIEDRRGEPPVPGFPQPGVPFPRWRDCTGTPNGPHECGPWHQGTP